MSVCPSVKRKSFERKYIEIYTLPPSSQLMSAVTFMIQKCILWRNISLTARFYLSNLYRVT